MHFFFGVKITRDADPFYFGAKNAELSIHFWRKLHFSAGT